MRTFFALTLFLFSAGAFCSDSHRKSEDDSGWVEIPLGADLAYWGFPGESAAACRAKFEAYRKRQIEKASRRPATECIDLLSNRYRYRR